MIAARCGYGLNRTARSRAETIAFVCRAMPRMFSGKPPEPAEVDDSEEIERAMDVMVNARSTVGAGRP